MGTCLPVEMLKGYMFICRNTEGGHGERKVGNPCNSLRCLQISWPIFSSNRTKPLYQFHLINQPRLSLFGKCWETTIGHQISKMKRKTKTKNEWT